MANHTFFKFMNDLIDSGIWAKLSSTAKTLYPVLCRFSDETFKVVWPGTEELLRLTGFQTKKSLQNAKKELIQHGLIDVVNGSGKTSSRYYFRFDYPNSQIDLESYRDTIISRRGGQKYPPEGYKNTHLGGTEISPNQINININQNTEKQERLLENLQNLLQKFVERVPKHSVENFKQHIIDNMLDKYGQLEVGEAIKIAIEKGKDGDIRYLEGILKNRKLDSQHSSKISKNITKKQYSTFHEGEQYKITLKNKFSPEWHDFIDQLEYRSTFQNISYFSHNNFALAQEIEQEAQRLGLSIRVVSLTLETG